MNTKYQVSYLDALEGGSGQTTVLASELPTWLASRPGTLIRELQVCNATLTESRNYKIVRDAARHQLGARLTRQHS